MPEQVRCPSCSATLRVPDTLLGKNVKCPKCQTTFVAETEAPEESERIVHEPARSSRRPQAPPPDEFEEEPPPEEEEDEDRPRRRRRGRRSGAASSSLTGPAIGLMVASGFSLLLGLLDLLGRILGLGLMAGAAAGSGVSGAQAARHTVGVILGGTFDVLSMVLPILIIIGSIKMMKLQNYGLALTSCILGMVPLHCCCFLGLPFGIWGLVMLNNPDVKDAFS
ncbi:MAG TPA: zinc-ribbon domain-containing protein [Gemmataceae bacterium]|nr:zinc-ribbon domain-containing protein [Gemmataceae bacterium]